MTATPKKEKVTAPKTVKVTAIRAFFVDLNNDEVAKIEADFKKGAARKHDYKATGMTKRIEAGETVEVDVEVAKKLQDAGVVKIAL